MNDFSILIIRAVYIGLFTGIVIAIPMGPAGIESVRWTLLKGLKQGVLVAAGSLIADAFDVMLINFGLLDLIETDKLLEASFWLVSGLVISFMGYRSILHNRQHIQVQAAEEAPEKKEVKSRPVLAGFILNFSNPMTHFFWLTLSSTILRVWRSSGRLPYFIFAVCMLSGMFLSLLGINYLASKGTKVNMPKFTGHISNILAYGIAAIGIGFLLYGSYKLYLVIA